MMFCFLSSYMFLKYNMPDVQNRFEFHRVDENPDLKRLRRSASSAMSKPRRSVNEKKKPSQGQETPTNTKMKKMDDSVNPKMHTRTASSQSSNNSKTSSARKRTSSSSSSSHVRTRSTHIEEKSNDKKRGPKLTVPVTPAVLK